MIIKISKSRYLIYKILFEHGEHRKLTLFLYVVYSCEMKYEQFTDLISIVKTVKTPQKKNACVINIQE